MPEPDKLQLYEILAREHEPMLMAYILSMVSDHALAEDIAQETFLVAYRKIAGLRKEDSFPAWLRGIARLEVLSALRKQKTEIPFEPAVLEAMEDVFHAFEQSGPAESWEERFQLVEECFKLLPETLQTVCQLHYFQDRKAREIADQLEIGLSAVLKRLERAREAIKECVQEHLKTETVYG